MKLEDRLRSGIVTFQPDPEVFVGFELTHGELKNLCSSVSSDDPEVLRILADLTPKEEIESSIIVTCRKSDIKLLLASGGSTE